MMIGFIDLETTGLYQEKGDRIVEIALSFVDYPSMKPLKEVSVRCNPQVPIAVKATEVHHITNTDVKDCPTWDQLGPKIHAILRAPTVLVAHNGLGFDFPFLDGELKRIGLGGIQVPCLFDTMTEGRWATWNGKLPSLKELCGSLAIPYDEDQAHAALYDVQVMQRAFFMALKMGFYKLPENVKC